MHKAIWVHLTNQTHIFFWYSFITKDLLRYISLHNKLFKKIIRDVLTKSYVFRDDIELSTNKLRTGWLQCLSFIMLNINTYKFTFNKYFSRSYSKFLLQFLYRFKQIYAYNFSPLKLAML